jgi:hypothetical protein
MAGYTAATRFVDSTTLRATFLALRSKIETEVASTSPDPELLDIVEGSFESIADAADRLSRLEARLRTQGDRRAVFLTIYTRMTRDVHEGIEHGTFADPDWMRQYVTTFANYYRRAFLAFERGNLGAVPDPWCIAFSTAINGDALIIQDAFLGMNAHINYDLALTLDDVGIDPNRSRKYADHRVINDILARLIDAQQDALADIYAAGVDDIDAVLGQLDESVTLRSMTKGREQAWRIAVVLTDVGFTPVTATARWVLRTTATGGAVFILSPRLDPSLLQTLRAVESEGIELNTVLERVQNHFDMNR